VHGGKSTEAAEKKRVQELKVFYAEIGVGA
jgi:hypothetical protein